MDKGKSVEVNCGGLECVGRAAKRVSGWNWLWGLYVCLGRLQRLYVGLGEL